MQIDRVYIMAIMEDVFRNSLNEKDGSDDNVDIIVKPGKGIWRFGETVWWLQMKM